MELQRCPASVAAGIVSQHSPNPGRTTNVSVKIVKMYCNDIPRRSTSIVQEKLLSNLLPFDVRILWVHSLRSLKQCQRRFLPWVDRPCSEKGVHPGWHVSQSDQTTDGASNVPSPHCTSTSGRRKASQTFQLQLFSILETSQTERNYCNVEFGTRHKRRVGVLGVT